MLPTTSYYCASPAFGARIAPGRPLTIWRGSREQDSESNETIVHKRHVEFAGALIRQRDSRVSKLIMFERLAVQGPKREGREATSWGDCLQKNLEAFGAIPRKWKGRKYVVFGVVVKDDRD